MVAIDSVRQEKFLGRPRSCWGRRVDYRVMSVYDLCVLLTWVTSTSSCFSASCII